MPLRRQRTFGNDTVADELCPSPGPVDRDARPIDRVWRIVFRLAYKLAKAWWFVRRPRHRGALVALWHDGEILLLSLSYRTVLNLPGGGIERGEDPLRTALREAEEEIGLVLAPAQLRLAQAVAFRWENRLDHVTIFEAILAERPLLSIDQREIVAARFRAPASIRPEEISPHVRLYLAGRLTPSSAASLASRPAAAT
jgi:8-oxo-dGTP diphosphatase